MSLRELASLVAAEPSMAAVLEVAKLGEPSSLDMTAPEALRPFVTAALSAPEPGVAKTVLVVTATAREADDVVAAAKDLVQPDTVVDYPAWETLPHERLSPRSDTVGRRLAVLRRLRHPDPTSLAHGPVSVIVAPVRSVLQPQVKGLGDL
ncbi:MAG: transcription-repair coupling factor, partial [Nocardioidaceae bacterium]